MATRVLLIEDDASFRKAVSDVLSHEGYEVLQAPSGKAGILTAQKEMPDLVVLDLIMPGMKGLEVCQVLKQDALTARVPIIILTGNDKDGQDIACLDMGADDYLTKPVKSPRLLAYCRALLRRTEGEAHADAPSTVEVGEQKLKAACFFSTSSHTAPWSERCPSCRFRDSVTDDLSL